METEYFYIIYVAENTKNTRGEIAKLGNKFLSTAPSRKRNEKLWKNYMKEKRTERKQSAYSIILALYGFHCK